MTAPLLLAEDPRAAEWAYIIGAYGLVIVVLVAYAAWTVLRGRQVGRQLPPEDRRWM